MYLDYNIYTTFQEDSKSVSSNHQFLFILYYITVSLLAFFYLYRNSDDNLLKNIELFDKLAVRFSSRVKFVRDIVGRGEICCWAFYGHAKKIAEVCCESIVYATDRKHTKIEFPEAKILDETLNIMLYERRSYDPPVALRRERVPRPPGTPEGVLSEDELR